MALIRERVHLPITVCLLVDSWSGVFVSFAYHEAWDHHSEVINGVKTQCGLTDKPRGGVDQGSQAARPIGRHPVIWGGEFGARRWWKPTKLPVAKGAGHHPQAFTM